VRILLILLLVAAPLAAQNLEKLQKEYAEKRAQVALDDVEGHRDLAKWCAARRLRVTERTIYRTILCLAPDDEGTRKALGHVKDGDTWYESQEAMRTAKGLTRRLTDWAEGGADGLTQVHEHWLTAEQVKHLEAGEPLRAHKGKGWVEVLTREYRITAYVKETDALELGRMMEQAVRTWREEAARPYEPGQSWTLHLHVLETHKDYVNLIKDDIETFDQELAKSHGFFDGRACWGGYFSNWYRTRRIFLHEGRHQFDMLIAKTFMLMPAWYREGTAEYNSVHEWDGKTLKMGVLNAKENEHLHFLKRIVRRKKLKGAEEMLKEGAEGSIDAEFYQNCWAFVYFLCNSNYTPGFRKWEAEAFRDSRRTPEIHAASFKETVTPDTKAFNQAYSAAVLDWASEYGAD
jgi:hypothetical protein